MKIETVSDLIEQLGGTVKVSVILGTTPQQVSNMRAENRIPPKHYFKLRGACDLAKIKLPQRLFEHGAASSDHQAAQ